MSRHRATEFSHSLIAALTCLGVALATTANALNCPRNLGCGVIGCACGDTVVADFQMTSNITCPTGHTGFGLRLASGVELHSDASHVYRIIGPGTMGSASYGLLIENTDGVSVLQVGISGFRDGVGVQNATDTILWGVDASNNGAASASAGIIVTGGSGNGMYGCSVESNGDVGVQLSSTSGTTLMGSFVRNNAHENISLVNASGSQIVNNTTGGGTASMIAKHSNTNVFTSNTFQDGVVAFVGSSTDNDFGMSTAAGNTISGARLLYQQLENAKPSANRSYKPQITNTAAGAHCIDFAADPASASPELPSGTIISEANLTCNAEEIHVTAGTPEAADILCACQGTGGGACDVAMDPGAPEVVVQFSFPCL